jgi:hypothetical protein
VPAAGAEEAAIDPALMAPESPVLKQEPGAEQVQPQVNGIEPEPSAKQEAETSPKPPSTTRTPRTSFSPVQRHSSRQTKQVERYVPEEHRSPTKPVKPEPSRRASSAATVQTATSPKSRRSSSNTSGTTHQQAAIKQEAGTKIERAGSGERGSTVESEDKDEKYARELQMMEHGLRRRGSMRLSS